MLKAPHFVIVLFYFNAVIHKSNQVNFREDGEWQWTLIYTSARFVKHFLSLIGSNLCVLTFLPTILICRIGIFIIIGVDIYVLSIVLSL